MPNKNYQRGRAAEYRVMARLRKEGWPIVLRMAGSHGVADVIALKPPESHDDPIDETSHGRFYGEFKLIQVKSGKSAERERKRAEADVAALSGTYQVEGVVL